MIIILGQRKYTFEKKVFKIIYISCNTFYKPHAKVT